MTSSHNPIDRALGLRPLDRAVAEEDGDASSQLIIVDEPAAIVAATVDQPADIGAANLQVLNDIEHARQNIESIITQGNASLKDMIALATQSESPRAYEVASTLMKTLLDANRDFIETSMKKKYHIEDMFGPKENQPTGTTVTNNNLILSTADLLKMIKGNAE
jgi:hypothetical protein